MNYTQYIQKKSNIYIKRSLDSSIKIQNIVNKITLFNRKTGEINPPLRYDFMNTQKNNYLWYNFVSTYMQNNAISEQKKAVFITLTLDSKYHPYKTTKIKKHIQNPNYLLDDNGYKLLQDSFRHIYNNFMISRKKQKIDYIRVIEPHKDFTPHLHAIVFIDEKKLTNFKKHFNNSISTFQLGSQYKYEVLENTQASVSYILKYVKKTINPENETSSRIIDGWKKENKIRMFAHSRIDVTREVYRVVSRYVDLKSDNENYSILQNLKDKIHLRVNYQKFEHGLLYCYKKKDLYNKDSKIKVAVTKTKKISLKSVDYLSIVELKSHRTLLDDLIYELYAKNFDFKSFHNYYYDYDLQGDIFYVASDYDYVQFFRERSFYNGHQEMIEALKNYLYECESEYNTRYVIEKFTIYDGEKCIYDKSDFNIL
jgi:hypothetical protein